MRRSLVMLFATLACSMACAEEISLSSLDLTKATQGHGKPMKDLSISSGTLSVGKKQYSKGFGTHANGRLYIQLDGKAQSFEGLVGVDDGAKGVGTVKFQVLTDGKVAFDSGVMKLGDAAKPFKVSLAGVRTLLLRANDAGDGRTFDHADWLEARIITEGNKPVTALNVQEDKVILTPKAGPAPRLNTPAVYGCGPGHDFIYRIPCTGTRPIEFTADALPEGLTLDSATGIITGKAPAKGNYEVKLTAKNASGSASKPFTIKSGDTLSLTPYMGWNHWYAFYTGISDKRMREAADAMVASGMADYGYSYVSIDDCWMRKPGSDDPMLSGDPRDEKGNIIPNKHFPDMKALTDYIHSKGLKAGTYTSPGPLTCTSYAGSYEHEAQDAKQYADWGFDLVKYDWCSYGKTIPPKPDVPAMQKPYQLMGPILKQQNRDIIFNLCQYGWGSVWEWGAKVEGHSWRTAGDLGPELDNFIRVAYENVKHRAWNEPGHWNDPDYIQIGAIGNLQERKLDSLVPCPLTGNEQYTYMSLWCLMASPLMHSGDIAHLDEFTLNVLCNAECIEVNQDELGQCAALADLPNDSFLLVKDMADGSKAIGICNGSETTQTLSASWAAIGIQGKYIARDLWRQKDVGTFEGNYTAEVPRHGTAFLRLRKAD